jgi:hypothetical protein
MSSGKGSVAVSCGKDLVDWKTCNYGVVVKWAALVAVELPPM